MCGQGRREGGVGRGREGGGKRDRVQEIHRGCDRQVEETGGRRREQEIIRDTGERGRVMGRARVWGKARGRGRGTDGGREGGREGEGGRETDRQTERARERERERGEGGRGGRGEGEGEKVENTFIYIL